MIILCHYFSFFPKLKGRKYLFHIGKTQFFFIGYYHLSKKHASSAVLGWIWISLCHAECIAWSRSRQCVTKSKTNGKLKFLYRNTKSFILETKKTFDICPHSIPLWLSFVLLVFWPNKTFKIQILQNKVIQYLLNLTPRIHFGANEFWKVNMIHMFKIINNQALNYLQISMLRDLHGLNTRFSQHTVILPQVKYSGADLFVYTVSKLWYSLTPNLQSTQSKYDFLKVVKSWLYSKYEKSNFLFH